MRHQETGRGRRRSGSISATTGTSRRGTRSGGSSATASSATPSPPPTAAPGTASPSSASTRPRYRAAPLRGFRSFEGGNPVRFRGNRWFRGLGWSDSGLSMRLARANQSHSALAWSA
jgi:hypothetical protein